MLRIGSVEFASNLMLAPVAGYCDLAFRLAIRAQGGLGLAWTDLVHPRGLVRRTAKTMQIVATDPSDRPLAIQLYGRNPDEMAAAAGVCEARGAAVVDINMGCPVEKICRRSAGAALLRDPETAVRVAERMVRAVRIPVTAKVRLGWAEGELVAPSLARALEDVGVAAVIVHGRSAESRFAGSVRIDGIARVVGAVRAIPVIGNGDVRSPADARAMIDRTGCAGVMIGRAALRDPWIFRDTQAFLATGRVPPPATRAEYAAFVNEHFRTLLRVRGERAAIAIFRQRFSWYARRLGVSAALWARIRAVGSAAEYWELAESLRRDLMQT